LLRIRGDEISRERVILLRFSNNKSPIITSLPRNDRLLNRNANSRLRFNISYHNRHFGIIRIPRKKWRRYEIIVPDLYRAANINLLATLQGEPAGCRRRRARILLVFRNPGEIITLFGLQFNRRYVHLLTDKCITNSGVPAYRSRIIRAINNICSGNHGGGRLGVETARFRFGYNLRDLLVGAAQER